jgi:hypothetical protein
MVDTVATIRHLLTRLKAIRVDYDQVAEICDDITDLLLGLSLELEPSQSAMVPAHRLRIGDRFAWQGTILCVLGVRQQHDRITVIAGGLPTGPVDITLAPQELIPLTVAEAC